jgi:hypothetical protein
MLRPNDVIELFKVRSARGSTDLPQLLDGLMIGGVIVVGGSNQNAVAAGQVARKLSRLGQIKAVNSTDAHELISPPAVSFDLAAIAQLLMIAKNEAFHETMKSVLDLLTHIERNELQLAAAEDALKGMQAKIQKL